MQLALCDAGDVRKERIAFWEDVYGMPYILPSYNGSLWFNRL
jgi:hypothetical protein